MGLRGPLEARALELGPVQPDAPKCPKGLLPVIRKEWVEYWASPVARAADGVDLPVIRRLFCYRDELLRASKLWNGLNPLDRWPESARGAPIQHPMLRRMEKLEELVVRLETQLGLTPMARARLGIELGNAELTWNQVREVTNANFSIEGSGVSVVT